MKWIINQDRDGICKYEGVNYFNIEYKYIKDICVAFNLWYRDNFLGTFDSVDECIEEIYNIVLFEGLFFVVNGYADYEI